MNLIVPDLKNNDILDQIGSDRSADLVLDGTSSIGNDRPSVIGSKIDDLRTELTIIKYIRDC